jgi:uncharacterized phage infection (PIP) family protein YhgE
VECTVHEEWQCTVRQLAEERAHTAEQYFRAEAAEQQAGQVQHLASELTTTQEQAKRWQAQTAERRAELAGVRSELTTTHAAIEAERNHGAQRLADQQARYEDLITELRTQLREAGRPPQQPRACRRTDKENR